MINMITKEQDGKTIIHNYEPKTNGIYKWTFISTTGIKIYIGKTEQTFEKRTYRHIYDAIHNKHCGAFQQA